MLCAFIKTIDAMDPWEDLTELGYHLADLPVEPHLGKMVLCSVVLKCLDPILTIACMLSYREPFVLPAQASQKRAAMLCRRCFAANTFSDHMALLRAFQVSHSHCLTVYQTNLDMYWSYNTKYSDFWGFVMKYVSFWRTITLGLLGFFFLWTNWKTFACIPFVRKKQSN